MFTLHAILLYSMIRWATWLKGILASVLKAFQLHILKVKPWLSFFFSVVEMLQLYLTSGNNILKVPLDYFFEFKKVQIIYPKMKILFLQKLIILKKPMFHRTISVISSKYIFLRWWLRVEKEMSKRWQINSYFHAWMA